MTIQHTAKDNKGRFFIPGESEGSEDLAEMTYRNREPNIMVIEHTEVSGELRGQNIGYQLVHSAVEYARTEGLKILPLCVFAKAVMEKKPEFGDVLEGGGR